jgi:hypothetical protein
MDWTIGRSIFGVFGIVVGVMMARNTGSWGRWYVAYGVVLLLCGVLGIFNTVRVYKAVSSSELINGATILFTVSILIHIVWPMIFVSRMLIAKGKSEVKGW